jgi:hypothetical protein
VVMDTGVSVYSICRIIKRSILRVTSSISASLKSFFVVVKTN